MDCRDCILLSPSRGWERPNGSQYLQSMPFQDVFDARKGYTRTTRTDAKRISNKDIAVGDVVLVEAVLSRTPSPVASSKASLEDSETGSQLFSSTSSEDLSKPLLDNSEASSEQASFKVTFELIDIILFADGRDKVKKAVAKDINVVEQRRKLRENAARARAMAGFTS